jgi:hypothetical protein
MAMSLVKLSSGYAALVEAACPWGAWDSHNKKASAAADAPVSWGKLVRKNKPYRLAAVECYRLRFISQVAQEQMAWQVYDTHEAPFGQLEIPAGGRVHLIGFRLHEMKARALRPTKNLQWMCPLCCV